MKSIQPHDISSYVLHKCYVTEPVRVLVTLNLGKTLSIESHQLYLCLN